MSASASTTLVVLHVWPTDENGRNRWVTEQDLADRLADHGLPVQHTDNGVRVGDRQLPLLGLLRQARRNGWLVTSFRAGDPPDKPITYCRTPKGAERVTPA